VEVNDAAALRRMDRKRPKKMSNEDWVSPSDEEAEITRLKDGRTALAFKIENAVDMETGAIVAVTTHGGAATDTETVEQTVIEAGVAVAGIAGEEAPRVHVPGVQEVVADRGYHSNEVLRQMEQLQVRTYIAEPERGTRNWEGKAEAKAAVYANRRRVQGSRGKRLQRRRGERVERNFAHQFDTGGMDRLWVRRAGTVHKKVLLQAAACNLALLMRASHGAGKPKAAHDQMEEAILATLAFLAAISGLSGRLYRPTTPEPTKFRLRCRPSLQCLSARKWLI
jgi:transposase